MIRRLARLALLPAMALVLAWDTRVNDAIPWQSAYINGRSASLPEHTGLADRALRELGVGDLFGVRGSAAAILVDLNASHFRFEQLYRVDAYGEDRGTRVEERRLPPPAHFAGLPDYSFGPSDWLNKNMTCPLDGVPNEDGDCHIFMPGWLGALNSVHFGSQATRMYAHYHTLALQRAGRARQMREAMSEREREIYEDDLKEAELQALMYEGYAQHFLQDRWALGHMWERWAGPDLQQLADSSSKWPALAVGGVAGLIHGSESVLNKSDTLRGLISSADPMSSPLPGETAARPLTFRHTSSAGSPPIPAVGDERLNDMTTGSFGTGYGGQGGDVPLDVRIQESEMLMCSKAGWAEVIRAFGQQGAGWGAHEAPLAANAPSFPIISRGACWDMWATNRSMYVGLLGESGAGAAALAGLAIVGPAADAGGANAANFSSTELAALGWRLWRRQWSEPDGTDVAQGGIGALFGFLPGSSYGTPEYAEPIDPAQLPSERENGLDKQTIFGAMNRAHSDHWCGEEGLALLEELRGSDDPREQQVCQYLADFAYQGTFPGYQGEQARTRQVDGEDVRSICQIRTGPREASSDDPRDPYFLDQGYVNRVLRNERNPQFGSAAAANWCERSPIIRLSDDRELANENVVVEIDEDAEGVEFVGQDFGEDEGQVFVFAEGRRRGGSSQVIDWSDRRIELDLREEDYEAGTDYLIEVRTADNRRSVGLFRLRVDENAEPDAPPQAAPVTVEGAGACRTTIPAFELYDLVGTLEQVEAQWRAGEVSDADKAAILRDALTAFENSYGPVREFLVAERGCILSRRAPALAALNQLEGQAAAIVAAAGEDDSPACGIQITDGRGYFERWSLMVVRDNTMIGEGGYWNLYARELDGVIQTIDFVPVLLRMWVEVYEDDADLWLPTDQFGFDLDIRDNDPGRLKAQNFRRIQDIPAWASQPDLPIIRNAARSMRDDVSIFQFLSIGGYPETTAGAALEGLAGWAELEPKLTGQAFRGRGDPSQQYCEAQRFHNFMPVMVSRLVVNGGYRDPGGETYEPIQWPAGASGPAPGADPGAPTGGFDLPTIEIPDFEAPVLRPPGF